MDIVTTESRSWDSSLIKWTEYTPDNQTLYVVFNNELAYTYEGVSDEEYLEFCGAESKGSYFAKHFRTKKTFKKDENLIQRTTLPFPDDSNNSKVGNKTQTDQYFFRMYTFNVQDFLGTAMPTVEESLQLTFKRLSVQTLA